MHECTGTLEKRVWKDHRVRLRCRKCGWMLLYRDFDEEPRVGGAEVSAEVSARDRSGPGDGTPPVRTSSHS